MAWGASTNRTLLLLHVHASLARTQHALLEHVTRVYNLTQGVGLRSLRQLHLEHGLVNVRVELLADGSVLRFTMSPESHLLDSLSAQHLLQLLLGHHHTLVERNQSLCVMESPHTHFIGSLALHLLLRDAGNGHAQVVTHAEKALSKTLNRVLSLASRKVLASVHTLQHLSWQLSAHSASRQGGGCSYP